MILLTRLAWTSKGIVYFQSLLQVWVEAWKITTLKICCVHSWREQMWLKISRTMWSKMYRHPFSSSSHRIPSLRVQTLEPTAHRISHAMLTWSEQIGRYVNVSTLKRYFNVSNSYVCTKLYIVLFPWWHRCRIARRRRQWSQHTSSWRWSTTDSHTAQVCELWTRGTYQNEQKVSESQFPL